MDNLMAKGILLGLAQLGLRIEADKVSDDGIEIIYISVPERSYNLNVHGEEMAGRLLAKRFKDKLINLRSNDTIVKWKTRTGEYWTKELAQIEEEKMKKAMRNF